MACSIRVKAIARILGNFGIAFFSPLIGGNVADTIFNIDITFIQVISVSFIAAIFTTGLAISREAVEYGKINKV